HAGLIPPRQGMSRAANLLALIFFAAPGALAAQHSRPALSPSDVGDIARLVMLEDRREFSADDLTRLLSASHPEVRRRAALAIGRINDKRGVALLRARAVDADTAVAATEVWAIGQLHDSASVPWLDSLLTHPAPTVATEAAISLGKIPTPASRAALARYLTRAEENARTSATIGEALLSMGRVPRGDLAPILKWTHSSNEEVRWRATWALIRPRDPQAVASLLGLAKDPSPMVRAWAVRGLVKPAVDTADAASSALQTLLELAHDKDRPTATEAVRALGTYTEPSAIAGLVAALGSSDSWISTSAAEGLGRAHNPTTIAPLVAATEQTKSCALRVVAMQALQTFAPVDALAAARRIARDRMPHCRQIALQTLGCVSGGGRGQACASFAPAFASMRPEDRASYAALIDTLHAERRKDLASSDALVRIAALKTMSGWADATDLPALRALRDKAQSKSEMAVLNNVTAAVNAVERRVNNPQAGPPGRPPVPPNTRTLDDYRRIVERWVVPDYNGAARPRAEWETNRGKFTLELYPGDAPLAVDDFVKTMESGAITGTTFTRVVPDFVDQEETIAGGTRLRDEVNRKGLTRANLAWATAGLDTGTPGYTLGHTPQPHNEGNFTSMGRVVSGMDVVDRIELGDRIVKARIK
ncbi:MAG TPA: HEAT repeat domain-containing protein, partial [Gemmatimonadaceae bacterium]|nr:HEAT repeat domain-containing protein [Gemmatimonadaceae bacterium]